MIYVKYLLKELSNLSYGKIVTSYVQYINISL